MYISVWSTAHAVQGSSTFYGYHCTYSKGSQHPVNNVWSLVRVTIHVNWRIFLQNLRIWEHSYSYSDRWSHSSLTYWIELGEWSNQTCHEDVYQDCTMHSIWASDYYWHIRRSDPGLHSLQNIRENDHFWHIRRGAPGSLSTVYEWSIQTYPEQSFRISPYNVRRSDQSRHIQRSDKMDFTLYRI
jgi:hypothetical protein